MGIFCHQYKFAAQILKTKNLHIFFKGSPNSFLTFVAFAYLIISSQINDFHTSLKFMLIYEQKQTCPVGLTFVDGQWGIETLTRFLFRNLVRG